MLSESNLAEGFYMLSSQKQDVFKRIVLKELLRCCRSQIYYFYCFNEYLSELKIDYSKCDCPIDSIILSSLGNKSSWSKLSIEEYEIIQKQITDLLLEKELTVELKNIGNMAYDFLIW